LFIRAIVNISKLSAKARQLFHAATISLFRDGVFVGTQYFDRDKRVASFDPGIMSGWYGVGFAGRSGFL